MVLKKEILEVLACPKCKGILDYRKAEACLACKKCRLKYKILEGDIPNMLLEEAEKF
jgi:uncharacterized protein YbaR (Trm112 family)